MVRGDWTGGSTQRFIDSRHHGGTQLTTLWTGTHLVPRQCNQCPPRAGRELSAELLSDEVEDLFCR